MKYNPEVWGPHYWFVLHSIANSYPKVCNQVTKRKYYDFIMNIPMFVPDSEIGNYFSNLLDKYPVTPYLDTRESFKRWMNFIHNKINSHLEKDNISFDRANEIYSNHYRPKPVIYAEEYKIRRHHIYLFFTLLALILIYVNYK